MEEQTRTLKSTISGDTSPILSTTLKTKEKIGIKNNGFIFLK